MNFFNQWGRNTLPTSVFTTSAYETHIMPYIGLSNYEQHADVDAAWTPSLRALTPSHHPLSLRLLAAASTGSDASNMILNLAAERVFAKHGETFQPRVLVMQHSYIASKGPISNFASVDLRSDTPIKYRLFDPDSMQDFICPSPATTEYMMELRSEPERTELESAEQASLDAIRDKIVYYSTSATPIGALMLELINVKEFTGFSYAFLMALRKLCTEEGIYLVVDEIMTGFKSWAPFLTLLYPNFSPDFILFGKSLLLSGVLAVNKTDDQVKLLRQYIGETTSAMDAAIVQKSVWVMLCYKSMKIFQHLYKLDEAFLVRFSELQQKTNGEFQSRGVGSFWKVSHPLKKCYMTMNRVLPIVTFPLAKVKRLQADVVDGGLPCGRQQHYSNEKGEPVHL